MRKANYFICIAVLAFCWSGLADDNLKIQMLDGKVNIEFMPVQGEECGDLTFTFLKPGKYTIRVSGSKNGADHNFLYLGELTVEDQKTPIYKRKLGASVYPTQKNGKTVLVYQSFDRNVRFDIESDGYFEMGNFSSSKKEVSNKCRS